jgi:TolB-like protein
MAMKSDGQIFAANPTAEDIRAELDRMATSDIFISSPQLVSFLRYVVESTLHGKQDRIKAYTIGVEVLRRDIKFDPQLDPIVRVEATRLRRTIERYYAGAGADDPIIIDLPRGSYIPIFRCREGTDAGALPAPNVLKRFTEILHSRPQTVFGVGLLLIAIVAALDFAFYQRILPTVSTTVQRPGNVSSEQSESIALPPGNGMPTIYVEKLRVTGTPMPTSVTATSLFEKINDAFARFDTINVVIESRQQASALNGSSQSEMIAEPRADYRLSGAVEYRDAQTDVLFRLIDTAESKVVWSRVFEQDSTTNDGVAEESIVISLANALFQSYGVIRARDRAKQLASSAGDPRYRCILEAADAVRSSEANERDRARICLEHLTTLDPSFAVGFAFLAITYNREFQQEFGGRTRDPMALDKALKAARRAIELQPEDSRAYLALFVVQYNRRELASAFAAAEKSLTLNKYDMLALGEYGGRLILAGDVEKGMAIMRQAGEYGAIRPSWHYFYLFMGSYLRGDMKEAAKNADDITTDNYALGLVAKAIASAEAKDSNRGRQAIERLLALAPAWREDPRGELARAIPDPAIVDRLTRDLTAAGLPQSH